MQTAHGRVNAATRFLRRTAPWVNNLLNRAPVRWTRGVAKHLKNIGVVSALTLVSRVLGLVRDSLTARVIGGDLLASAFFTAFRLPNLFRRLLAEGSLTAAFVPTLQEELRDRGRAGAFALLSNVTCWLLVATGSVVVLAMAVYHSDLLLPAQEPAKWRMMADLTVLLFPYLVLVSLAAAFSATLQVMERFTEPALSPIWLNLAMIAALGAAGLGLADTVEGRVHWLCAGALVGGFFQMAVPAAVLVREGWRPRLDLSASPQVRLIAGLMAPGILGTAVYQINQYVVQLLAYHVSDQAASVINYATRLMELPIGVFSIAIATVVYPVLARHAAEGNAAGMAADYRKGLGLILLINVPAAVGLAVLAEPIVRLLFEGGRFTPRHTAMTVPLLQILALGMPFLSVVSLTTRAFYARRDTGTPVKVALVNFVLNAGLCFALMGRLGAAGLAIAGTAAVVVQTFVLQLALARRQPGLAFGPLWPALTRVVGAAALMGGLTWGGWRLLAGGLGTGRLADAVAVLGLIPLGAGVFFVAARALRVEGLEEIAALVTRRGRPSGP
jgi:putative peptidoglycan lipid II flippase